MATLEFPLAPLELSLLVGDCLQNLRSALDHEVYRLTAVEKGRLSKSATDCAFPIYEDDAHFSANRDRLIGALSLTAQEFIRSVQPFAVPHVETAEGLRQLNRLARVDRHRILMISAAQPKSITMGPPVIMPGGDRYAPVTLDMELRFVDPDFLGLNTLTTLENARDAVASTIERMRAIA